MPAKKKDLKALFVWTPVALAERLQAIAKRNRRSVTQEAVIAFERYVDAEETADTKRKGRK